MNTIPVEEYYDLMDTKISKTLDAYDYKEQDKKESDDSTLKGCEEELARK